MPAETLAVLCGRSTIPAASERRAYAGLVRHQQILDRLAAGAVAPTARDEVRILAQKSFFAARRQGLEGAQHADVVPAVKERWHFALDAARQPCAPESDRMNAYKAAIAIATSLHEVGLGDHELTELAIDGIHALNDAVWLGDDFLHRTDDMIALLRSSPVPLTRKPTTRETITFTRGGDLLAIRLRGRWVVGHIHLVDGPNKHPHIELYERTFAERPDPSEVIGTRAWGYSYEGRDRANVTRLIVSGLRHLPDPAEQIHLLASGVVVLPDNSHLHDEGIVGTHVDVFELLEMARSVNGGTF
ncbi:hypothetical protein [Microbacterium barkeri]|uniref:hypothetical protein n=1 Tax=Microbacterium barkeri TaxID=33917 RepID=UPI00285CCE9B|nr:hypothetical protein [Microbacterium barkeri]MDR6875836.1 hypothetical protein [Microbacterium barkeri]